MAKAAYKRKIEDQLSDGNPWRLWEGIQQLTNCKGCTSSSSNTDISLAEALNCFFARFEVKRPANPLPPPAPRSNTLPLPEQEVRQLLRAVNPRKAAGPDGVPSMVRILTKEIHRRRHFCCSAWCSGTCGT